MLRLAKTFVGSQTASATEQVFARLSKQINSNLSKLHALRTPLIHDALPILEPLTIPLPPVSSFRQRVGRRSFSTRSSFREDYDEWYSHGHVGGTTRSDEEGGGTAPLWYPTRTAHSFVLEDVKQEGFPFKFPDEARRAPLANATAYYDGDDFLFEEGDDDFDFVGDPLEADDFVVDDGDY